jgi:BirA family transcriptional regulator, biotin operon repressor / biotin---[acetyl-CoA-carboxylase] ligase
MDSINQWTEKWAKEKGMNVWFETETTSTNAIAKQKMRHFEVYLTDHQTAGRGRGGAHWHEGEKHGTLLSSWTFTLNSPPQPIASPLFGLAVYTSLKSAWPQLPFSLKAPNDIYLGDKKLAGLLIEGVSIGKESLLVVGLGMNVFSYPKELNTATHIAGHTPVDFAHWVKFLDPLYSYFNEMAVLATDTDMPEAFCHQLREALNYFPLKDERVVEVDARGNIITDQDVIRWFDL